MFLEKVNVLDFTARLPGPYAGYLLEKMGAKVTKVENINYPDPFNDKELKESDPIFSYWYKELNANKDIVRFNFSQDLPQIFELIDKAQIILMPHSEKLINLFKLKEKVKTKPLSIITIAGGSGKHKAMHDLNAIASIDAFNWHIKGSDSLPFLPFAGISFGQKAALCATSNMIKSLTEKRGNIHTLYLDLATKEDYAPFANKTHQKSKHLHTGKFPCYNLYKTKDSKAIALCAVEEKYWSNFCAALNFSFQISDRHDTSGEVKKEIQKKLQSLSAKQIEKATQEYECCITIIGL